MIVRVTNLSESPLELAKMDEEAAAFDAFLDKEYQATQALLDLRSNLVLNFDLAPVPTPVISDALPPTAQVLTGTRKITIRLPNRLLAAYKTQAERTGTRYQTLITRTLNTASRNLAT